MVIIALTGAKRSTVREDHAIKGPGIRLDLDVRRVWRCPSCQRVLKTAGHVTSRRCPIDDAFMQLDDSAQRAARPVNLPAIDDECDDNNPVGDDDGQSFVDLMAGDVPSPSEWSDDVELRDRIRTAVDELPPHYREILLLSYYQRMSYNQIAETLEIPLGTVKSRLHSAVEAFGKAWEPESQEGEAA